MMRKGHTVRLYVCLIIVFFVAVCCSCSKKQDIHKLDPAELVVTLKRAAIAAEKSLGIAPPLGTTYIDCMDQAAISTQCKTYFGAMLVEINKIPGYQSITLSDLTDKMVYSRIHRQYVVSVLQSIQS